MTAAARLVLLGLGLLVTAPAFATTADSGNYNLGAKVWLTQRHPNETVYTVYWTGKAFHRVEAHTGSGSAFDFEIAAECPDTRQSSVSSDSTVYLDASIESLRLRFTEGEDWWAFEPGDGQTQTAPSAGPDGKQRWSGRILPTGETQIDVFAPAETAVRACNARYAQLVTRGASRGKALAQMGTLAPFQVRARAELLCMGKVLVDQDGEWQEGDMPYEANTTTLALPMKVQCAVPPPEPHTDALSQNSGVTNVALTPVEPVQQTSCPATVRYEGSITSNGPIDELQYRFATATGPQGPVRTVSFPRAMTRPVALEFEVDGLATSAGALTAPASGFSPAAARSLQHGAATAPGELGGWVRLEVLGGPNTNEAFWKVICETPTQGATGLSAQPPDQRPLLVRPLPIGVAKPAAASVRLPSGRDNLEAIQRPGSGASTEARASAPRIPARDRRCQRPGACPSR